MEIDRSRHNQSCAESGERWGLQFTIRSPGQPWKTRKTDPPDCESAIATSLAIVRGLAVALHPFLPDAADRLARSLGAAALPVGPGSWAPGPGGGFAPAAGAELGEPEVLFPKMDDATFEEKVALATQPDG